MVQFEAATELAHQRMKPREMPKSLHVLYKRARERLVDSEPTGDIRELYHQARESYLETVEAGIIDANADALFLASEPLRFRLSGLEGDLEAATRDLQAVLKPFTVAAPHDWTKQRTELTLLEETKRERLIVEVDELLFLLAVALDRSGDPRSARLAVETCDRAIRSSRSPGAWKALRARLDGSGDVPVGGANPSEERSASTCFQWGLLRDHEGRRAEAIAWLERAVWLEPSDAWYHLTLALQLDRAGRSGEAQAHADAAVALRPRLSLGPLPTRPHRPKTRGPGPRGTGPRADAGRRPETSRFGPGPRPRAQGPPRACSLAGRGGPPDRREAGREPGGTSMRLYIWPLHASSGCHWWLAPPVRGAHDDGSLVGEPPVAPDPTETPVTAPCGELRVSIRGRRTKISRPRTLNFH